MQPPGAPACCMSKNNSPGSCGHLQTRQNPPAHSLGLTMGVARSVLVKRNHSKTALESKASQTEQTESHAYFNWHAEVYKSLVYQNKFIKRHYKMLMED